jgi:hypothetical protein
MVKNFSLITGVFKEAMAIMKGEGVWLHDNKASRCSRQRVIRRLFGKFWTVVCSLKLPIGAHVNISVWTFPKPI